MFLACRQGQFKIYYLEVIIQKKERNGTVKLKMSQWLWFSNFKRMDTSTIYILSLINPIHEIYLSFRIEWPRYHQPFIRTLTTDLLFILHCCFVPEKCIWFCQYSCLPTDSEDFIYSFISDYTHIQRFKRFLTQWKGINFTGTWKKPHIYLLRLPSRFFLSLYFQKLRPENDKYPTFTINF